jgi:hypothetical protein
VEADCRNGDGIRTALLRLVVAGAAEAA